MKLKQDFSQNSRDIKILETVYDYRYMSVELLVALLGEPPDPDRQYGFSESALRARCQKLRMHGYLKWQFLHDLPTGRGYHTARPAVYSLGPAAIPTISERNGIEQNELRTIIKRNTVGSFFLRHSLGISKFRVCLTLACRETQKTNASQDGKTIEIGAWFQEGLNDKVTVLTEGVPETIPVAPDAFFSLIVTEPGGKRKVSHFALEYDRGTMPMTDIVRKARGYWHYLDQKLYRRKYTYAGSSAEQARLRIVSADWDNISADNRKKILDFSIKGFQVLFVSCAIRQDGSRNSPLGDVKKSRRQSMIEAIRRIPEIRKSTKRFKFVEEDVVYGIQSPIGILYSDWMILEGKCQLLPS
ncbi:MAG: replication-relaxation family protein [bacterium]|jgi:hypothetical protein